MSTTRRIIAGVAIGSIAAVTAPVTVPAALGAVGFGSAGIAAGSLAASAMSTAMVNGVGMGAVAVCQSIGAAGLGAAGTAVTGMVAGTVGALLPWGGGKKTKDSASGPGNPEGNEKDDESVLSSDEAMPEMMVDPIRSNNNHSQITDNMNSSNGPCEHSVEESGESSSDFNFQFTDVDDKDENSDDEICEIFENKITHSPADAHSDFEENHCKSIGFTSTDFELEENNTVISVDNIEGLEN